MGYLVKNVNFSIILSLTSLKTFGLWPSENLTGIKRLLYCCYGFFCFMFSLGSFIITQIIFFLQIWGDIPMMTATGCLLFTNLAHFAKIVNLVVKRRLIQTVIHSTHVDLTSETSDEGKKIVKRCNFQTKVLHLWYHFITLSTITGWAVGPDKGQLPIPNWYPFDVTKSPVYEIMYSQQVIAVVMCGYLNVNKDSLVVTLIAQCHCRLRLLGLSLRTICKDINIPENRLLTLEQEKIVKSRLRTCVVRHQAALEAAEQLQQAFSEPIFMQFLVSLVIICVSAFQMIAETSSIVRLVSMVSYLMNMLYQLFIYCYQGNQLAEESLAVADAVYAVPWHACGASVRRSLVLVSLRSRRVALLVAGGFTPLSLNSFMSIIKASYSLFTLLRQVEERNSLRQVDTSHSAGNH